MQIWKLVSNPLVWMEQDCSIHKKKKINYTQDFIILYHIPYVSKIKLLCIDTLALIERPNTDRLLKYFIHLYYRPGNIFIKRGVMIIKI